jgi:hypothetical protein
LRTASPEFYLDPNQAVRKMADEATLLAKKEADARGKPDEKKSAVAKADEKDGKAHDSKDSGVQKASLIEAK